MLVVHIPKREWFDEIKEEFVYTDEATLKLEHSLISIQKWEAKYKKPFVSDKPHTQEEMLDYIRFMTLNKDVKDDAYNNLTNKNREQINEYINDPMTATWFNDSNANNQKRGPNGQAITAEKVYYWMTALQIPFECEKWHFNQLMTLIKVCSYESQPKKKMSRKDIYSQNRSLNEQRKKAMHSKG